MNVGHNIFTVEAFKQQRIHMTDVGFVPTMGALHDGHLALIKACLLECQTCIVSIYVNPTQFAAHEDLNTYPKTLEIDLNKLHGLNSDIIVVLPTEQDMYPNGIQAGTTIQMLKGSLYEGMIRPHFFGGVCTIVTKLLNLVQPKIAYFGQKDFQQASIITQLVQDLLLDIQIRIVPTIREPNGLAMSSRNIYLSKDQKTKSLCLYNLLQHIKSILPISTNLQLDIQTIKSQFNASNPFQLEYLEIVHGMSLEPVLHSFDFTNISTPFYISNSIVSIMAAIKLNDSLRLIDNLVIRNKSSF